MNQRLIRFSIVKIMTLCLFLAHPLLSGAQEKSEKSGQPKIALVLSGGGAKGFAHIGVLKVLEEEGIPIDLIVGTSMGSLVGGIYSLGYNALELERLVKSLNWEKTLSDEVPRIFLSKNDQLIKQRYIFSLPIDGNKKLSLPQGLVKGQNVLNIFCGLAGNVPTDADFSKFTIPFACVATDLETGKEVVLSHGFLPTAMFSSMAIPIAFKSADRNGFLLADGGLVNNFPTDVAKKMGADIIIGVDIRSDFYRRDKLNTIENVMGQLVGFFDMGKDSINKSNCNLIIRPDITGYSVSSFNNQAVDTLIIRGENAANGFRQQLRELKMKYKIEKPEKSRELVKPDQWHITNISFTGNYHLDQDYMGKILGIKIPGNFSSEDIKTAIDRLYGLGGFELIYFNLVDTEKGKTLNLTITAKEIFTQNIGFKANTTDAAAILINTTRKNYKNVFGLLSASAELSRNPGLTLIAESNRTKLPTLGISLKGKYQNYNVFENGDKIFDAKIFYTSGALYLYKPFLEWFNLGLGLQEEYYQGDIYKKKDIYPIASTDPNTFLTNAYSYLSFDNMDDFYFPRKGTNIYAEFSLTADFKTNNNLSPAFLFKMRNVVPVWHKTALIFDFYHRALFNADFPQPKITLVGGEPYSQYFSYHLPFVGLTAVNIAERYTFIGLVGLRRQVSASQYFSVLLNCLKQTNDMAFFNDNKMIFGGGIKYGLKTFVGPMDVTLGYSGSTGKPTFSANFGYWF